MSSSVQGSFWEVEKGEISEQDQFLIRYLGSDTAEAYFPIVQLSDLISVLSSTAGASVGALITGTYLQARKVDAGYRTDVRIEPRSDTFPAQIMSFGLELLSDLSSTLTTFNTGIADREPEDWDGSEPSVIGYGSLPPALSPPNLNASIGSGVEEGLADRDAVTGRAPVKMTIPPTVIHTKGVGAAGTPTVVSGGTGYVVGEEITLSTVNALLPTILRVSTVSAGAVTDVTVVRRGVYTAAPSANPVAQSAASESGTGATFNASWGGTSMQGAIESQSVGQTDARMRFTGLGPANIGGSGYHGQSSGNGTHSTFEWASDTQRIDLKLVGLNTRGALLVDGALVSFDPVDTDASGAAYTYSLDFGYKAWRNYKWIAYNNAFGGIVVDGDSTVSAPIGATRPFAVSFGDSYTAGSGAETAASGHISVMASILGVDVLPEGVGSSGWNTASPGDPETRITNKLSGLSRSPQYVFFDWGYNDAGGNMTSLRASFDAAVAAVRAEAPDAEIICFGPATPVGATANLDLVQTALMEGCTAESIPFVDVRNWVDSSNQARYTGGDNVHPTALGHKYLGARRVAEVAPLL